MNETDFGETMKEWFENNRGRILAVSPMSLYVPSGYGGGFIDLDVLDSGGQIVRAVRTIVWPTGDCDVESLEAATPEGGEFVHYDLTESQQLVDVLEGVLTKLHPGI